MDPVNPLRRARQIAGASRSPVVLVLAFMLVLAGCSDSEDRLHATVHAFADALSRADPAAAAALTTDGSAASEVLGTLFDSLGKDVHVEAGAIEEKDGAATFTLDATWKFGPEKRTEWTYSTDGAAVADGDDWKIEWNAATVAPGLNEGPLSYSTLVPQPAARVLDRTGAELLTQHVVTLVEVAPGADLNAVAALVNPIAPGITPESLAGDLGAAGGQSITAITLRQDDLTPIEPQLSALPNVTLSQQTQAAGHRPCADLTHAVGSVGAVAAAHGCRGRLGGDRADGRRRETGGWAGRPARRRHRQHAGHRHAARRRGRAGAADHPGGDRGDPAVDGQPARRRAERAGRRAGPDRADRPVPARIDVQDGDGVGRAAVRRTSPPTASSTARAPRTSRAGRSPTTTTSTSVRYRCTRRSRGRATPPWAVSR